MSRSTNEEDPEVTREGLFGMLAGKAKEAAGELLGNDDLVNEGRQKQAEVDADAEAAREADHEEDRAE
jgi:uncharacterized protein YjbJ (UPF0337 family)